MQKFNKNTIVSMTLAFSLFIACVSAFLYYTKEPGRVIFSPEKKNQDDLGLICLIVERMQQEGRLHLSPQDRGLVADLRLHTRLDPSKTADQVDHRLPRLIKTNYNNLSSNPYRYKTELRVDGLYFMAFDDKHQMEVKISGALP